MGVWFDLVGVWFDFVLNLNVRACGLHPFFFTTLPLGDHMSLDWLSH